METRKLGNTDLRTKPVVFGGNVFGWTLDEKQSMDVLDQFLDAGFNAIDTADSYSHWVEGNSGGESETILGKWFKQRQNRDRVLLITKVGSVPGKQERNVHKEYIIRAAEESLRRLHTDVIDLYMTHWDNEDVPVDETLEAYHRLVKSGKVRYIGASNVSPARIRESLETSASEGFPAYEVLQPQYNLVERQKFETDYLPLAQEHGLGVITYYSLASGFLTGKYRSEDDLRGDRAEAVKKYMTSQGMRILEVLDRVTEVHDTTPAAISLAWIMQQPGVTAPIASATKPAHIAAFREAASIKLSAEEVDELNRASGEW